MGDFKMNSVGANGEKEVDFMSSQKKRGRQNSLQCPVDPYYLPKQLQSPGMNIVDEFDSQTETRLLVLYTGGTIGMMRNSEGVLEPAPMTQRLKEWPLFHDAEYANEHYHSQGDDQPYVLPMTKEAKRIVYSVIAYSSLLDSCNMTMTDWARIATDIKNNYMQYDGFVILHGTDTMAYTASALSFMLENLGKPVILTGSQIPIFELRSDGRDNFIGALIIAGQYLIPEVTIYFNHKLMRGNRSSKQDASAFEAFSSPNLPPLAKVEIDIHVDWPSVFKPSAVEKFRIHTSMCPHVGLLRLFPSISQETVEAFLKAPMRGIVMQTYGAGNGPDARKDLLASIKEATSRGLLVVNITQCSRGYVTSSYATGKALSDAGIIAGGDMTPEAALTKLSYVLGHDNLSYAEKQKLICQNMRGELTVLNPQEDTHNSLLDIPIIERMAKTMQISSAVELEMLKKAVFPSLLCTAAIEDNVDAVKKLLEAGATVNMHDYDGRTALHIACSEGSLALVHYLLEQGAPVHQRDRFGNAALDDAVRFDHHDVIKILVQGGAHLNMSPHKLGVALCLAATNEESTSLVSWYLAKANLSQGDYCERTALHVAAAHKNIVNAKFLLEHGANPDVADSFGISPIDEAMKNVHHELIELLQQYCSTNDHQE